MKETNLENWSGISEKASKQVKPKIFSEFIASDRDSKMNQHLVLKPSEFQLINTYL